MALVAVTLHPCHFALSFRCLGGCSLMRSGDTDGTGKLNFEEFLRLMIFEKRIFLKNAFTAADKDGNGYLTQAELLAGLEAAGYDVEGSRNYVAMARGGADGRINYNEFVMNL